MKPTILTENYKRFFGQNLLNENVKKFRDFDYDEDPMDNQILAESKLIKEESGLMVIGRTPLDNNSIGDFVEEEGFHAEWDAREGYWLFPEEEENYDNLEIELEREFNKRGINARFEGIF
jgi:hypothetical protein